jgi:plasmid maintenance system antidote protein VapI
VTGGAEKLGYLLKYRGVSEQFWLSLQDAFAVHQVKEKYAKELKAIKPLGAAGALLDSLDGTNESVSVHET